MIAADLDDWAEWMERGTGMRVTRDPGTVHPPCIFIDAPSIVGRSLGAVTLEVPVMLLAAGQGKQAGDWLLDNISHVQDVLEQRAADPQTVTIGTIAYPAFRVTTTITITRE